MFIKVIFYSIPNPNVCKIPTIHTIGFQSTIKPIIDEIEKTDQNQKPASWVKTGKNSSNNMYMPKGMAAKTNAIQTMHFIRKTIIFNNT